MNTRALSRLNTVAGTLAIAAAVHAGLTDRWLWLAASAFVVVATQMNVQLVLAAAGSCVVVGAWPVLLAAGLDLAVQGAVRLRVRFRPDHRPLDRSALAALVRDLPLKVPQPPRSIVDTSVLLAAAVDDDRSRWPTVTGPVNAPANKEGGVVPGTRWTVVAAEAILVAGQRPDTAVPLDIHTLAATAALLPYSLAQHVIVQLGTNLKPALDVLGLTSRQVVDMTVQAGTRPGGELIVRRARRDVENGPKPGGLLTDDDWAQLAGGTR